MPVRCLYLGVAGKIGWRAPEEQSGAAVLLHPAQDIFDLHIIPADSDFRMFSARHYGR